MKVCSCCGVEKSDGEFYAQHGKLAGQCKACLIAKGKKRISSMSPEEVEAQKLKNKQYYEKNKQIIALQGKIYRAGNSEAVKKRRRKYYENNKGTELLKCKERYEANKEAYSARGKEYYQENREKLDEANRQWALDNPEKASDIKRRCAAKNREKYNAARIANMPVKNLARREQYSSSSEVRSKIAEVGREYREKNGVSLRARNRVSAKAPRRNPAVISSLPVTDEPMFENGVVTVACKMCRKRYAPATNQISKRLAALRDYPFTKHGGEGNFYCSTACKKACPIFGAIADPRIKTKTVRDKMNKDRNCRVKILHKLQCDEVGHNYCEKCGDIVDVEKHHTIQVGAIESDNTAGHVLLCAMCHIELHKVC